MVWPSSLTTSTLQLSQPKCADETSRTNEWSNPGFPERREPRATTCRPSSSSGRFFYFAAFRRHIGIYPPVTHDRVLIRETAALRGPKGNLPFPHTEEMPLALIEWIAAALATEYNLR